MGSSDKSPVDYLFFFSRHEAEEGGEAMQGGVEELSTGLAVAHDTYQVVFFCFVIYCFSPSSR